MTRAICYELQLLVSESHKTNLVELLIGLGEDTFVEGAVDCDNIDFDYDDPLKDYYAEMPTNSPIIFYSEDLEYLTDLQNRVEKTLDNYSIPLESVEFLMKPIANQDWQDSWKASFKPIRVDDIFCILPPWEKKEDFSEQHKIVIDPGMAFGTGQHETTQVCLKILNRQSLKPERVFDVGAGSGILAIAARMWGAKYAFGCDIDPDTVSIAAENAQQNGVDNIEFSGTPLEEITENDFDLVFANIQIKPLMRILPEILKRTRDKGKIIISGILESEKEEFIAHLKCLNLVVNGVDTLGHWIGIECEKS